MTAATSFQGLSKTPTTPTTLSQKTPPVSSSMDTPSGARQVSLGAAGAVAPAKVVPTLDLSLALTIESSREVVNGSSMDTPSGARSVSLEAAGAVAPVKVVPNLDLRNALLIQSDKASRGGI